MPVDEDGMRTLLGCGARSGIAEWTPNFAGFVRTQRRQHHARSRCPPTMTAFPFKRGSSLKFFHRDEEGVHVDVEDGAEKRGLLRSSHAARILAAAVAPVRSAQSDVLALEAAVRIRIMHRTSAIRTTISHRVSCSADSVSLFTGVPCVMLQGIGLPVQSEWVIFVVALEMIGVFSVTLGVLPRSWIAKACRKDQDDQRLFSALLKVLAIFAGVFYLVAVFAYFSPNRWNLNPQLMLVLCPMYLVKMTFDPSPVAIFFPACSHERSGVRLTRPHRGIRMVCVFEDEDRLRAVERNSTIIACRQDGLRQNRQTGANGPRFASADSRGGCPYASGVESERYRMSREYSGRNACQGLFRGGR